MDINRERGCWSSLCLEIRFKIWGLVYASQEPRLVEIQTAKHDHYSVDHRWCPRYSPSPPPKPVNICREARNEARRLAQAAGHLIFPTPAGVPDIYFNPEIDTLYIRNEKDYWIRDWGPEGVLTQYRKDHSPELLRLLAVELDPITRATTNYTLYLDLRDFPGLKQMTFVVKEPSEEIHQYMFRINNYMKSSRREYIARRQPRQANLAIRRALELLVVEQKYKPLFYWDEDGSRHRNIQPHVFPKVRLSCSSIV